MVSRLRSCFLVFIALNVFELFLHSIQVEASYNVTNLCNYTGAPGERTSYSFALECFLTTVKSIERQAELFDTNLPFALNPECLIQPAGSLELPVPISALRAEYFFSVVYEDDTSGKFEEKYGKGTLYDDDFELVIPGVGLFKGKEAGAEYSTISDSRGNGGFSADLQNSEIILVDMDSESETVVRVQLRQWGETEYGVAQLAQRGFSHPCSLRFYKVEMTFDEESIAQFSNNAYNGTEMCEKIQEYCQGENQQYDSQEDCESFFESIPKSVPQCGGEEVPYNLKGNTSNCRFLHHFLAESSPEVHCAHVGKGELDINGKLKCSEEECSASTSGRRQLNSCSQEEQEDIEIRILGLLTSCTYSYLTGVCSRECKSAQNRFAFNQVPMNTGAFSKRESLVDCAGVIQTNPMSSVLRFTNLDLSILLNLLVKCDEYVRELAVSDKYLNTEFNPDETKFRGHGVLQSIFSSLSSPGQNYSEQLLIMERDYLKDVNQKLYERSAVEGGKSRGGRCPMFHGSIATTHADVTALLTNSTRRWSNEPDGSFAGLLDNIELLKENSHAPVVLDAGDIGRVKWRKQYSKLFPSLSAYNKDVKVPYDFSTDLQVSDLAADLNLGKFLLTNLAFRLLSKPGTSYNIEWYNALVEELFVGIVMINSNVRKPHTWHEAESFFHRDLYTLAERRIVNRLRSHFGASVIEEVMDSLQNTLKFRSENEMLNSYVANILINLGLLLSMVQGLVDRMVSGSRANRCTLCEMLPLYKENPRNFILEHLRLSFDISTTFQESGSDETIEAMINLANRDPDVFPDPYKFDPRRDHLTTKTVTFHAPEYYFTNPSIKEMNENNTMPCIAHDFVLNFMEETLNQLVSNSFVDGFCSIVENRELNTFAAVFLLVDLVFVLAGFFFLCFMYKYTRKSRKNILQISENHAKTRNASFAQDFADNVVDIDKIALPYLTVRNLEVEAKLSKKLLLHNTSFDLKLGTMTAIIGASGASKTTLLSALTGVPCIGHRIRSGAEVKVGGNDSQSIVKVSAEAGDLIFENLTVSENMMVACHLRFSSLSSTPEAIIEKALRSVDIWRKKDTISSSLSTGEQRRLSIAMEIIRPCNVLCLDEPTSGLDSASAIRVIQMLQSLSRQEEKCILITIHQPNDDLIKCFDSILLMKLGRLVSLGPLKDVQSDLGIDKIDTSKNGNSSGSEYDRLIQGLENFQFYEEQHEPKTAHNRTELSDHGHEGQTNEIEDIDARNYENLHNVAGFRQRVFAQFLGRYYRMGQDGKAILTTYVVIAILGTLFIAIPNSGKTPETPETVGQLTMLVTMPSLMYILLLSVISGHRAYEIIYFNSALRAHVLRGNEFITESLLWHFWVSTLFVGFMVTICLLIGLVEYVTFEVFLGILTSSLLQHYCTLALFIFLFGVFAIEPRVSKEDILQRSDTLRPMIGAYLGLSWVMSGFLYRLDYMQIDGFYKALSYTSPSFWGFLSSFYIFLPSIIFPGCDDLDYSFPCWGVNVLEVYNVESLDAYMPFLGIVVMTLYVIVLITASIYVYSRKYRLVL